MGVLRALVSQVDVVASCSLRSIIIERSTKRLAVGLVLPGQRIANHSSNFKKKNYCFHINGK